MNGEAGNNNGALSDGNLQKNHNAFRLDDVHGSLAQTTTSAAAVAAAAAAVSADDSCVRTALHSYTDSNQCVYSVAVSSAL